MPDLNMITAYRFAGILFYASERPECLPNSLIDITSRTRLLNEVNKIILNYINSVSTLDFLKGQMIAFPEPIINEMFCQIAEVSRNDILGIQNSLARTGLLLCMWSGCMDGAKTIAARTKEGENTPQQRERNCGFGINPMSRADPLYRSGVEAAPVWKRLIGQGNEISFEGVPVESPLRTFMDGL